MCIRDRLKPVAANVDRIVIVFAPRPEPHANLIDRYLIAAEHAGIQPLLLLNKADLVDEKMCIRDSFEPGGEAVCHGCRARCRRGGELAFRVFGL